MDRLREDDRRRAVRWVVSDVEFPAPKGESMPPCSGKNCMGCACSIMNCPPGCVVESMAYVPLHVCPALSDWGLKFRVEDWGRFEMHRWTPLCRLLTCS